MFFQGSTQTGRDQRTEIVLSPQERAVILSEMRQLLAAVQGILAGLSHHDRAAGTKLAVQAARSGGMAQAADVDPSLMLKLPLAFKEMGMSVHRDLDRLADDLTKGASVDSAISGLASITSRCVACHETFRLPERQATGVALGGDLIENRTGIGSRHGRGHDQDPYGSFRRVASRSVFQESFAVPGDSNGWNEK